MPLTNLCLALALVFAAVAETNINKDGDVVVKFDGDHGLTSEKKEVDRFQYTLHNLTPSAVDGHGRVKRLQQAVGGDEALPLCIMTFNIRTNTFEGGVATHEDMVIARVSYSGLDRGGGGGGGGVRGEELHQKCFNVNSSGHN